ncbi:SDR family NAD(P)-dependent oxidoreductase [Pseudolactococcus plantarum]|uniref:Short chain dehydrogenase n=1 Tax=Pseudolactococcus plantarum TaxID=1365 RepID=A0A2A5RZ95_9LACT|nr:SDR family NAD(P)-dependent oxidoreductase [Lactococcus plantarum]PCS06524.1 Short chain dehydrogenase [Lactococcus plantarum]HCN74342.1 KR domain-containing protein [Lactococcus sp.]
MKKVVVITGASNGMGLAAAKLFASKGWLVYGGARRVEKIPTEDGIHALRLDVTDHQSNTAFIETIIKEAGRIDVLINNAGYGEYGAVEEVPLSNAKKQFETNFFGAAELSQLVLPTMRQQKSGRIINISSIGANVYLPLGSYYHATKAALQLWSDALDMEVKSFGVRSITIQPGLTRSAWGDIAMDNARKNAKEDSVYLPLLSRVGGLLTVNNNAFVSSADKIAALFYKAATDQRVKGRYFNSVADKMTVWFARSHPYLFNKTLGLMLKRVSRRTEK